MSYVRINLLKSTSFSSSRKLNNSISSIESIKRISLGSSNGQKPPRNPSKLSIWLKRLSMVFFGLSALLYVIIFIPQVREFVDGKIRGSYVQVFSRPTKTFGDKLVASGDKKPEPPYQPTKDSDLSMESRLVIDKIGVNALINESSLEEVEEALSKGVWRAKEFGTPYGRKKPTILASHRFGFLSWTNKFRRENSFYNLPDLKKGDEIEVYWSQRRYAYEVYDTSEGSEIEDYGADLILYTCRFLDSDVRIFTYAKLIEL